MRPNSIKGFTLSELLVSLVILGVIAAFTIPKVLQSQQADKRKAVFRETISTLAVLTAEAARTREITNVTTMKTFFRTRLNYVKLCSADPNAEGCWSGSSAGNAGNVDGYLLHNGAMLASFNGAGAPNYETVNIDWNGLEGPNTVGDDIITNLVLCFGPSSCSAQLVGTGPRGAGVIGPGDATAEAILVEIFE